MMKYRFWKHLGSALLALSLLGPVRSASASPLLELVGSGVGTGGLNARATGASAASAYFNPALLPKAKQGFDIGWLVLSDSISVTLGARSPAVDVPTSVVNRVRTDQPPFPTEWLERGCDPEAGGACTRVVPANPRQRDGSSGQVRAYQMLGLVNHLLNGYLSLGLYAMVPLTTFTQADSFFVDEREQFFSNSIHPEMYADRLTPVSLAFGAGSRIVDWLSLGLSFTLSLRNVADAGAYVGNSARLDQTLQLSTQVDVSARVSPHLSVLIEPIEALDLSLTLHSPQKMVIETAFGIYLPDGDIQSTSRRATHSYIPWILGFGANYDVHKDAHNLWSLVGTLSFERWSQYVNRQSERPLRNYEFRDTVAGGLGLRYARDARWTSYFDLTYRPTPVPPQTGRTNYVDNDRVGFGAGVNYEYPIERWDVAFRFGANFQAHFLVERSQTKLDPTHPRFSDGTYSQLVIDEWPDDSVDVSTGQRIAEAQGLQTNNPGWPGFSSRGTIVGGGLSLSLLY